MIATENSIPLPTVISNYLEKMQIKHTPYESRSGPLYNPNDPSKFSSNLSFTVENLARHKTPHEIEEAYKIFKDKIIPSAPSKIQRDLQQFLFPFFIHLVHHFYVIGLEQQLIRFIDNYKFDLPAQCQPIISSLVDDPINFRPERYKIQITQLSYDELLHALDELSNPLVSYILLSEVEIEIVPSADHEYLFTQDTVAAFRAEDAPLLNQVPVILPNLSAQYSAENPPSRPTISREDGIFIQQNFPDVAHIEILNYPQNLNCAKISPNARLLSMALGNNVNISSLDGFSTFLGQRDARLVSHASPILSTAFSADSVNLASGDAEGSIRLSNLEAFRPYMHFQGTTDATLSLCYSPNGSYLAASYADRSTMVWSTRDGAAVRIFRGHTQPAIALAFSADGARILTAAGDLCVRLWDVAEARTVARFPSPSEPSAIALNWSNSQLAIGCRDGSVALWETTHGTKLWASEDSLDSPVTDVAFTRDGTLLIASALGGSVRGWRTDEKAAPAMHVDVLSSTVDTICVTERNAVITAGRSVRGNVVL